MMRKVLSFLALVLFASASVFASVPQRFTFQAVVRNASGELVQNQQVGMCISLLRGSSSGTVVYSERHTPQTNENGLFAILIGGGSLLSGSMEAVDWSADSYYIRCEADLDGGTNYTLSTVQQLVGVPYALHAHGADTALYAKQLTSAVVESQALSISNDTIYLTGGSSVKLPAEQQVLSISNDTIYLTGGSYVKLPNAADLAHNVYHVDTCDQYSWHGVSYTTAGTYVYAYSGRSGFYATDTLYLTLRSGTFNSYRVTANNSYSWHGTDYTATGVYQYSYFNVAGCRSVDTLRLSILAQGDATCSSIREAADTTTIEVCDRYVWYGAVISQSGVRQHNFGSIAAEGCDSIVRTNFVIHPNFSSDTTVHAGSFPFSWRGHSYNANGDYTDTLKDIHGCDSAYTLHLYLGGNYGVGAVHGLFSVGASKSVRFAHGNLQYVASTNIWSFANQQYELYGATCASSSSEDVADLFGWGATGYYNSADDACLYYNPWDNTYAPASAGTEQYTLNMYGWGPSTDQTDTNLVGTSRNYDWGEYLPIFNGGNQSGLWRLLTKEEWDYLLFSRSNASMLRGYATVNGVTGYVLLADDWTCPDGCTFSTSATNDYTVAQWAKIEANGAVFLPYSTSASLYWSSTALGSGSAWCFIPQLQIIHPYGRSSARMVRLVQDDRPGVTECLLAYVDTTFVVPGPFTINGTTYTEDVYTTLNDTIYNARGCDTIVNFQLIIERDSVLPGSFSVSASHQVRFSVGNLFYQPISGVWVVGNAQYERNYGSSYNKKNG